MKKLLAALLFAFTTAAHAGVPCSVPFNLTNGTTADASQVMANYNAILACLANGTAASGANNDITALLALTTPIPPAGGGTTSYIGSSVSGTNAIVVAATIPSSYSITLGYRVSFIATGANTAATTLTVAGSAGANFYRQTPEGPQSMVGGEIVAGQVVEAEWDGTEYQMVSQPALGHAPGEVFDFAGSACPVGSLETTGSSLVSQTLFPTLYTEISTIWGVAVGGNFTIPDLRGRTTFSRDSGGSGRITSAGGNFDGTVVGNVGGQQNQALSSSSQIPQTTVSSTISGTQSFTGVFATGGASNFLAQGGAGNAFQTLTVSGANFSFSTTIGSASPGSFATLSNGAIVLKCIKG